MEIRDYIKIIQRRFGLIVLSVGIVTAGAVVTSALQKPVYEGVSKVLVTRQNAGITVLGTSLPQSVYQPERDLQTQVELIQSRVIAEQVRSTLRVDVTAEDLLRRVTASADTGADMIEVRATAATAVDAANLADAFANSYTIWSRDNQRQSIRTAADDVERRLLEAQERMVDLESKASAPSATGADAVRLTAAESLYATLADKLEQLRIAEQLVTGIGSVIASATVDPTPVSPRPTRNAALGLTVGLLVGLGAAFMAEHLDTRIGSAEEAGTIYGAPVLVAIPAERVRKNDSHQLTLRERPGSAAAEAYRVMRNNLDFVNIDKGIKTLLVTSAVPTEGKSTVAANLAAVLSQAGMKVMLIGCDFHQPTIGHLFDLDQSMGLADVLQGKWDLWTAAQRPEDFANLWVLTAGTMPPNPSALLGSEAMGALLAALRERVDWVILDTTPVLSTADATALVRWVDGVIVVARMGLTTRDSARAGGEHLRKVGARILGLAAWGFSDGVDTHSYGGYRGYGAT